MLYDKVRLTRPGQTLEGLLHSDPKVGESMTVLTNNASIVTTETIREIEPADKGLRITTINSVYELEWIKRRSDA